MDPSAGPPVQVFPDQQNPNPFKMFRAEIEFEC
jgi:hypothetical protein